MLGAAILAAVAVGAFAAPRGSPDVVQGKRLATELGCHSCHDDALTGKRLFASADGATLYSSNLTTAVRTYTDRQLDHVIRTGERPDGTRLWYMDAAPYAVLTPEKMKAIRAYLRGLRPVGTDHPRIKMGPRFLKAVQAGQAKPESATLDADLARPAVDLGPRHARGRYLARTRCGVCHAPDLGGTADPQPGDPPDLAIAGSYDRAEFRRLLQRGEAPGGKPIGEMATEARKRFARLSDGAADAIYDYLAARARR